MNLRRELIRTQPLRELTKAAQNNIDVKKRKFAALQARMNAAVEKARQKSNASLLPKKTAAASNPVAKTNRLRVPKRALVPRCFDKNAIYKHIAIPELYEKSPAPMAVESFQRSVAIRKNVVNLLFSKTGGAENAVVIVAHMLKPKNNPQKFTKRQIQDAIIELQDIGVIEEKNKGWIFLSDYWKI